MALIHETKKIYGLIGYPLGHSFSMDYFNQKFASEGINAEYINFAIEDVGKLMEIISQYPNIYGLNVTAPYKEQVIPYMNSLDETAQAVGAVNVIKFIKQGNDFHLRGYNSDVPGFERSLEPLITPERNAALILGTGGAAKAIAYAIGNLGLDYDFVSRHKRADTIVYEELTREMIESHKIIVDCTPLGMYPHVNTCPDIPYQHITPQHLCYDLVYNPDETLFMRNCRKQGAEVKNGLEMLLLQAFVSYDIWNAPSPI